MRVLRRERPAVDPGMTVTSRLQPELLACPGKGSELVSLSLMCRETEAQGEMAPAQWCAVQWSLPDIELWPPKRVPCECELPRK